VFLCNIGVDPLSPTAQPLCDRGTLVDGSSEEGMRGMKSIFRILALVVIAAGGLWYFTFGSFEQEIRYSLPGGYPLPAFALPVLDDGLLQGDTTILTSEDLEGNVLIVSFWATWCSPCLAEQPTLLALQEEFGDDGLTVLGILDRDDPGKALAWLKTNDRLAFETVVATRRYSRAAGVGGLPHTFLVDRQGEVVEVFAGWSKDREPYFRERVRELTRS
jgi:thiol-disulfide isomerase/thioredoxin